MFMINEQLLQRKKERKKTIIFPIVSQNWGSSRASIEAKFYKVSNFLGFMRYFSARIEQSSKNHPKLALFGSDLNVFDDFSILAEK